MPWLDKIEAAKTSRRLPVVLTHGEVAAVLSSMEGTTGLVARLLYGTGMRIMEGLRLRVKDVDFGRGEILVRDGKGAKDRVTMLPVALESELREHLARVRELHRRDLAAGHGEVYCPTHWTASIRRPGGNGAGSMFFRRPGCRSTRVQERYAATT